MHFSSYVKAEKFLETYGAELAGLQKPVRVIEIGSKSHNAQDTYRGLFPDGAYAYTGLDIEAGANVDIVPANPFVWGEIADNSFELCISGQTFEHNPYFWITFAEMARVLRPGGLAFIVAPGAGQVHRYPLDCWRFYPDSWSALCVLTGMELVESYFEGDELAARVEGGRWRDSAIVARKPRFEGAALTAFHARLEKIVELFREEKMPLPQPGKHGPWVAAYKAEAAAQPLTWRAWWRRKRVGGAGKVFEGR